ncbi:hypothetical protein JOB18_003188, partial [Solea senegalensis]
CLASSHSPSIIYRFVLHQRDAVPSPAVVGGVHPALFTSCLASSHSSSIIYRFVLHQRDAVPSPAVVGGVGGRPPCTLHQLSGFLPQSIDHLPLCPPPEGRSAKPSCQGGVGGGPPCTLHQLSGFLPQSIDHLPLCPPPEGRSAKPSCRRGRRRASTLHSSPVRSKHSL